LTPPALPAVLFTGRLRGVGSEEWSFSLTKECFERQILKPDTIHEGPVLASFKFRDQKTTKTPRFACSGSGHSVDHAAGASRCTRVPARRRDAITMVRVPKLSAELPSLSGLRNNSEILQRSHTDMLLLHVTAEKIVQSCPNDGDCRELADRLPTRGHGGGQDVSAKLKF
jgi:hypothetical protein